MSNAPKSNLGNNITAIIVALLGTIGAIGGAYITTYGVNSAERTEAAPTTSVSNNAARLLSGPETSAASPSPAPQPTIPVATEPPAAAVFLPNSQQISYNKSWPNDHHASGMVLETVEVADSAVRVHVRFDNTSGDAITFYTSLGDQGIRSYISDKKEPQYAASSTGGELFADPSTIEIAAGSSKRGWIEYNTGGAKLSSLNLYLTSTTNNYPAGQSGAITYSPIKLKVEK